MSLAAIGISLSGMTAATRRLEASASNVANARTTGRLPSADSPSTAYQPLTVQQSDVASGGVAASFAPLSPAYVPLADPASPDADAEGLVAAPNVDLAGEMVEQMTAVAAYRANAAVIRSADDMLKSLLDTTA